MVARQSWVKIALLFAVTAGSCASIWSTYSRHKTVEELQRFAASYPTLNLSVREQHLTFSNRALGRAELTNAEIHHREDATLVHAKEMRFGAYHFSDATFTVRRPKTAIKIGLGEALNPKTEITIFPSAQSVSQWMVDIESQSLGTLAKQWGFTNADALSSTQVAGAITIAIPDAPKYQPYATVQLVFDRWPLPKWPDAAALFGTTIAVGGRLRPSNDVNRWEVQRAEVTTGVFPLKGTGALMFGNSTRLSVSVKGQRTCEELSTLLPPSTTQHTVARYVAAQLATAAPSLTNEVAPAKPKESVELSMHLDLIDGPSPSCQVRFHLSGGCGLLERLSTLE
jgi:hypothetical protein